jgi:hypothetical protein
VRPATVGGWCIRLRVADCRNPKHTRPVSGQALQRAPENGVSIEVRTITCRSSSPGHAREGQSDAQPAPWRGAAASIPVGASTTWSAYSRASSMVPVGHSCESACDIVRMGGRRGVNSMPGAACDCPNHMTSNRLRDPAKRPPSSRDAVRPAAMVRRQRADGSTSGRWPSPASRNTLLTVIPSHGCSTIGGIRRS